MDLERDITANNRLSLVNDFLEAVKFVSNMSINVFATLFLKTCMGTNIVEEFWR